MSEFKNGELVMVSDSGNAGKWILRKFIGKDSNGIYFCEAEGRDGAWGWIYCKPIPKKTYRPFKDVFEVSVNTWFRVVGRTPVGKINGIGESGVVYISGISTAPSFQSLLNYYEMSTDGVTWTPAGAEE